MYKSLLACALVAGLSSCANPQQAQNPQSIDTNVAAPPGCPPGLKEYCLRQEYRSEAAATRVKYARKNLELAQKFYEKHPDAQHAADLEEAKARLNAAVANQEAGY